MSTAAMNFSGQPVDLRHLDRYTGGERALNEEILKLFDSQCQEMLDKMQMLVSVAESPEMAKAWREVTHTLKGAARGVGAFGLGDAAAAAEKAPPPGPDAVEAVAVIKIKAEAVTRFIDEFLKTGA